jgi:hypothetical protein
MPDASSLARRIYDFDIDDRQARQRQWNIHHHHHRHHHRARKSLFSTLNGHYRGINQIRIGRDSGGD